MSTPRQRIEIYDTTLRDGTQSHNVSPSLNDKLMIAAKLDSLGIDYIEGGYPLSNARDAAFFHEVRHLKLSHAKVAAFGMTRHRGTKADKDEGLKALLDSEAPVITIVGKTWDMQVRDVMQVSEQENLDMIAESVEFLVRRGREVLYDAEHFFDGWADNPDYALKTLLAAQEAGTSCLVLCDTNGGCLPQQIGKAIDAIRPHVRTKLGIHTHNDAGLAVANALTAIQHGAVHAQGTINGIGERCGNVDLTTVAANLAVKMNMDVLSADGLKRLTEVSRYVYEVLNLVPPDNQPYVGPFAFAHKGGMHVHAIRRVSRSYEHVDPVLVGNERRVLISELSGASGVAEKIGRKLDVAHDKQLQRRLLKRLQECEEQGYVYESAEASFELLCRKELGLYHSFWELDHWRAVALRSSQLQEPDTEVIVRLRINGTQEHHVAGGHGPVDAMANALMKALRPHYPEVDQVRLIDYKVRVINARAATAARVRVTIEFRNEATHDIYGTVGVSENIIEASWIALVDGIEYSLISHEEMARATGGKEAGKRKKPRSG
jgi:2-isopropylmalate synthase